MAIQWKSKQKSKGSPKQTSKQQVKETKSTLAPELVRSMAAPAGEYSPDQIAAREIEASRNKHRRQSKLVQQSQKRDREFEISYKQILLAADQGKKWAIVELGAYAEYQRDYQCAIEQYERLAAQGDLYYMRRIAVIYEQSLEDIDSAIDWYTEAGHYGDEYSMIRAGNLLELHFEDFDEALAWYRKAAQLNNLPAIYHLCRIYQHSLHNFDKAIEWYNRAVQLGDLRSAISLGKLYENYLKDYAKAVEWYSMAANHKSLYAINLLCQLYEIKLRDYPHAIEWYKRAIALYNEQNGSDVVAADSQGQLSMNAAKMPDASYTSTSSTDNSENLKYNIDMMNPDFANYSASAQYAFANPSANPRTMGEEFGNDLFSHSDHLTPTEVVSVYPDLSDEAEIEFLG